MKRAIGVLLLAAGACLGPSAPSDFVFEYSIGIYGCDPLGCETPDSAAVSTAAPGDTVWVRHEVQLLQTIQDSVTATVRPGCAENAIVRTGSTTVQSIPTPATCPDSTASQAFVLGAALTRHTQWVLDPGLSSGTTYAVIGRLMVNPALEPIIAFHVQ